MAWVFLQALMKGNDGELSSMLLYGLLIMSSLTFTALLNVLWEGLFHILLQLCRMATFGLEA